jgi:hypothetical protein
MLSGRPLENMRLLASPVTISYNKQVKLKPHRRAKRDSQANENIKVSQGELFLDMSILKEMSQKIPDGYYVTWFFAKDPGARERSKVLSRSLNTPFAIKVIVKVTSQAAFGHVVGREGLLREHRSRNNGSSWLRFPCPPYTESAL